jgi:myo-inositol-1-phosphate synthase
MPASSPRRVGLWLIGAFGGVGTTITLGLAALGSNRASPTGLVSDLPWLAHLDLPAASDFVVGGHEIRETSFADSAEEFRKQSGVFDPSLIDACRPFLDAASSRVRPGTKLGAGPAIARLGSLGDEAPDATPARVIDRLAADLAAFVASNQIDHLIVLNVASTEPPFDTTHLPETWAGLDAALSGANTRPATPLLPASSLYAIAALRGGHTYINFTPNLGASTPAIAQLADGTRALHAGKDGKTGETLMKTVLAPMFAARNLQVMSWVGHNIFGNRDGVVLDDPAHKAAKVVTKDRVVSGILGYKPSTLVSIEYVPDMGDWKTAWDHIHFRGFLGCQMTLQFTWQGCDSLLAAPLAIDLARLADAAKQRGETGLMTHLSCFFKSPENVAEHDFFRQLRDLEAYAERARD